jgi:hypothetical protein
MVRLKPIGVHVIVHPVRGTKSECIDLYHDKDYIERAAKSLALEKGWEEYAIHYPKQDGSCGLTSWRKL